MKVIDNKFSPNSITLYGISTKNYFSKKFQKYKKWSKTAVAVLIKHIEFVEGMEFAQEVGGQAIKIIHTAFILR